MPDDRIAQVETLPEDWRALPHPSSMQEVGRAFLEERKALALKVPSVLVPEGWNLVLNPRHPAFPEMAVEGPFPC